MSESEQSITVYSDYVCPFCYLGRESLRRYQETRTEDLQIDWHPFDLRSGKRGPDGEIDNSVEDGKDEEYYQQARENVKRLQEQYDVEMAQGISSDVDSLTAQALSWHIKQNHSYETWLQFDKAVLDALWKEGQDIGDEDLLVDLAESAGVDREEAQSALENEEIHEELQQQFVQAQQDRVTGVPTFAYDGYAARGAVPPEQLERLVEG